MNYFNHQNVQLAYEAVYNQDLCESMEDLGLIGEYDELNEVLDTPQKTQSYAAKNAASAVKAFFIGDKKTLDKRSKGAERGMNKIQKRKTQREEVELYDIILEYLIQEGYADTLGSAEIILENMSEEWIEDIMEAKWGKQEYPLKRVEDRGNQLSARLKEMGRDLAGAATPQANRIAFGTLKRLKRLGRSYGAAVEGRPQPVPPGRKGSNYRRA